MNIISYKGPGSPGGVSATLSRLFKNTSTRAAQWCYVSGNSLHRLDTHRRGPSARCHVPQTIVDGHYRYCNEFLWPVLHDLPQYSSYSAADRLLYNKFNLASTTMARQSLATDDSNDWFVNDYQFAVLPALLANNHINITVFWHIPWPKHVQDEHIEPLSEVAEGLLGASQIGFHTQEYADNFLRFVQTHCLHQVDPAKMQIMHAANNGGHAQKRFGRKKTTVLVRPLGIDTQYWQYLADNQPLLQTEDEGLDSNSIETKITQLPYVLSVDRCDYTKGISQRFSAIDAFVQEYPQYRKKLAFVQICQPSRQALPAFAAYWTECRAQAEAINHKWQDGDWQPINWVDTPVSAQSLSLLYRRAKAMLITPIRDGLNLTAKEYIACTDHNPGVLLLSEAAGAWHELGQNVLTIDPHDSQQVARQIAAALSMPIEERLSRASSIRDHLQANDLTTWTRVFGNATGSVKVKRISPPFIGPYREKHAAV